VACYNNANRFFYLILLLILPFSFSPLPDHSGILKTLIQKILLAKQDKKGFFVLAPRSWCKHAVALSVHLVLFLLDGKAIQIKREIIP
jgi:hypothetical protein